MSESRRTVDEHVVSRGTDERADDARVASSITWRVFVGTAVIVAVVVLVSLIMATTAARRSADASARRNLEQAADLVAQLLAGRERSLAGGARVFVQAPYFRTLVAERRRDDVLDQTFEAVEQLDATWVFITDGRGTLLAKSDEPSAVGDALGGVPLIASALRGQLSGGFGTSGDSLIFQAIGVPIALPDGAPFGVLVATRVIDSAVIADMRSATASELVFFVRDAAGRSHVLASTLPLTPAFRESASALATRSSSDPNTSRDLVEGDVTWLAQSASLSTAGGDVIGGFLVLRPRDGALATLAGVRRSLFVAGALGFVLALAAAWFAARSVTRPIRTLAVAMQRAADGNYVAESLTSPESERSGEIGSLARAFDALLLDLRDKDSLRESAGIVAAVTPVSHAESDGRKARDRVLALGAGALRSPVAAAQTGQVLANRYRLETVIGSGGMGIVYRAHDRVLGEIIAIKLLRPELIALEGTSGERLREELRMTRRITHRNVVRTHDIGESDGVPFLTMEYVDGASLSDVIHARGALPVSAVLSLARQLMRALVAAHEQDVVHGDIKPQNLLVGPSGVLKVTDFGIARVVRSAQRVPVSTGERPDIAGRLGGATIGTPEYLAPEVLIGAPASTSTDLYAAGMVLHECLVGVTPFSADTPMAFLANKLSDAPTQRSRPAATVAAEQREARDVPSALDRLLAQLTHADPEHRPPTAFAVLQQLAHIA